MFLNIWCLVCLLQGVCNVQLGSRLVFRGRLVHHTLQRPRRPVIPETLPPHQEHPHPTVEGTGADFFHVQTLLFISKTARTVKDFTPVNIAWLRNQSNATKEDSKFFMFNLMCQCLLHLIYIVIHLAKILYSSMKVNSMFCFTWFIL